MRVIEVVDGIHGVPYVRQWEPLLFASFEENQPLEATSVSSTVKDLVDFPLFMSFVGDDGGRGLGRLLVWVLSGAEGGKE